MEMTISYIREPVGMKDLVAEAYATMAQEGKITFVTDDPDPDVNQLIDQGNIEFTSPEAVGELFERVLTISQALAQEGRVPIREVYKYHVDDTRIDVVENELIAQGYAERESETCEDCKRQHVVPTEGHEEETWEKIFGLRDTFAEEARQQIEAGALTPESSEPLDLSSPLASLGVL